MFYGCESVYNFSRPHLGCQIGNRTVNAAAVYDDNGMCALLVRTQFLIQYYYTPIELEDFNQIESLRDLRTKIRFHHNVAK